MKIVVLPRLSFLGDWDEPFYEIAKMRGRMNGKQF
jgi:hypothetical protein